MRAGGCMRFGTPPKLSKEGHDGDPDRRHPGDAGALHAARVPRPVRSRPGRAGPGRAARSEAALGGERPRARDPVEPALSAAGQAGDPSLPGRPSAGSWIWYGIGAEAEDLPGFVVLTSHGRGGQMQPIAARQWHSGCLPSRFQGVQFRSKGDAVLYLRDPEGVDREQQRDVIDAVEALTKSQPDGVDDPEVSARLSQYEMAFKMQTSIPALTDFSSEPRHVLDSYGVDRMDGSFAGNCLLARRLAERGVRFIQLYHRDWDHHSRLKADIAMKAKEVDRASAALVKDLKDRGMLDETLVIWGGEFGRTPMAQADGRDHHIKGFSIWLAGGGIRGGMTHGATDELGYQAVQDVVAVHDLHATMLYLLGIDHTRLTFKLLGRDFRLTDVHGEVVKPILA